MSWNILGFVFLAREALNVRFIVETLFKSLNYRFLEKGVYAIVTY